MKKVIFFLIAVLISAATQAQEANSFDISEHGMQMFRICATIFLLIALMMFVLAILKRILEFRIRNRIVDKGVPESLAASLLKDPHNDSKHSAFKWFAMLAGTGVGLTLVNYTMPLGVHSIAIMSFSIAASFLGYYLFIRKTREGEE